MLGLFCVFTLPLVLYRLEGREVLVHLLHLILLRFPGSFLI